MIQSGGFLGRLLFPLLKTEFPLLKNVIKPSAKSVLNALRLTVLDHQEDHLRLGNSNTNNIK